MRDRAAAVSFWEEARMQFLMRMRHGPDFRADPERIESIHAWVERTTREGVRLGGHPLRPCSEGVTIRRRDGALERSPILMEEEGLGPVAAVEVIECDDLDAAVSSAATHPMASVAHIEVRAVREALARPR